MPPPSARTNLARLRRRQPCRTAHARVVEAHPRFCPDCARAAAPGGGGGRRPAGGCRPRRWLPTPWRARWRGWTGRPRPSRPAAPATLAGLAAGRWRWTRPGIAMMPLMRRDASDSRLDLIRVAPGTALLSMAIPGPGIHLRPAGAFDDGTGDVPRRAISWRRMPRWRTPAARVAGRALHLPDRHQRPSAATRAGSAGWCARCWACERNGRSARPSCRHASARAGSPVALLNRLAPRRGVAVLRTSPMSPGRVIALDIYAPPRRGIAPPGPGGGVHLRRRLGQRRSRHVPLRRCQPGRARHADGDPGLPPVSRGPLPGIHVGCRGRRGLDTGVLATMAAIRTGCS